MHVYLMDCLAHALGQADARLLCVQQRLDHVQWRGEGGRCTAGQRTGHHVHGRIVLVIAVQLQMVSEWLLNHD